MHVGVIDTSVEVPVIILDTLFPKDVLDDDAMANAN